MTLRFDSRSIGPMFALFACIVAPAQTAKVSFSSDVAPILAKNCAQCHGPAPALGSLDLASCANNAEIRAHETGTHARQ
jgi:mono/diheme cytochrome c family protein